MSKAIRDAYGETLAELGQINQDIVVLDADVSGSTKSAMFANKFPDRFFNVGIAETNMTAMAAGLSTMGRIPFINTFAIFLITNGLVAIRELIAYTGLNVKIMGAYSGLSDSYDGPTHQAIEDIAVMRALPNMRVLCPCDEYQTDWMIRHAADVEGPVYVRLSRAAMPKVYSEGCSFDADKGCIVKDGSDATIIACGIMVGNSLEAAKELEKQGINVRVVDMFSIKPIDEELITKCAEETGVIITAEEHSTIGGLGGAVAEVLAESVSKAKLTRIGVKDCFAECGPYDQLLKKYGLDANAIVKVVRESVIG